VTGRMIHIDDDWKKLKEKSLSPELYRLRRNQKMS
jgi:hypothetical protein